MRNSILKRASQAFGRTHFVRQAWSITVTGALLLAATGLFAAPTVSWFSGGPNTGYPSGAGYVDGDITLDAEYHTPCGLAIDSSGNNLFVADRDNNAVRWLMLDQNWTYSIGFLNQNLQPIPGVFNKPVGVALNQAQNLLFVLNRGTGANGSVLEMQVDLADGLITTLTTNFTTITNAGGIAVDSLDNFYVTASNQVFMVTPSGVSNLVATVTAPGASLQGIVFKQNGLLAVCDSGRNGVLLIDPTTGIVTTNAGFHGPGDFFSANNIASSNTARFFQPTGVAETGDGTLIVTDYGNSRVKAVLTSGIVTNLYGVTNSDWVSPYPGFMDGTVQVPDRVGGVAARLPNGVVFASDGSFYVTEDYYHIIRHITGAGLIPMPQPPPPPPPPPPPSIGWFDYEGNNQTGFFTVLHPVTSAITFNNDTLLAINPNTNGAATYYIDGSAPFASVPNSMNGSTPPFYQDGLTYAQPLPVTTVPNLVVKAVNVNAIGESSPVVTAEFIFQVANPIITGNNAAQFTVSDITTNVSLWYTLDGTSPTNAPPSIGPIILTNGATATLSLNASTNVLFQVSAFRSGYQPSGIAAQSFSPANFVPNTISFGFASGEASSEFIASPGQTFYAPVTLSPLPNTTIYSLQFNLTVTNAGPNPGPAVAPGAYNFGSMLWKPVPGDLTLFEIIPPLMYVTNLVNPPPPGQIVTYDGNTNFVSLLTDNLADNLISVGWVERAGATNLYNTLNQDLIQYSAAHDDFFLQSGGKVILGGFNFQVPVSAGPGQNYQIQIGRPSATSDGIGAPGSSVFIYAPTNGSLGGGIVNSIKNVTIGQIKYLVGNVYPFRWFNAGDFGNTNLQNADVEQVFEAVVYGLGNPPPGSDFFDAMDSSGGLGVFNAGTGYYTYSGPLSVAQKNALFNGNDTTINQIPFGDGVLDVSDVYVTYRRSLDPTLTWYNRFWTNGVRVAETTPNIFNPSVLIKPLGGLKSPIVPNIANSPDSITNQPKVNFASTDFLATPGQTLQVPITANIFGSYPLRLLMLNLTVVPIDGSPALTTPVTFSYNPALGAPWTTDQHGNGNYSAVWLNSGIAGLSNNVTLGTLTVTIPTNAIGSSAYAIHFDHASASPNGIASFPKQTLTGLITLSNRSGSSWGDAIPDSWRLRYFLTLNNLLSATNADADGDGLNNLQEYIAGTDPTDPTSNFKNIGTDPSAATQPSDCVVSWPSVNGKQYVIERSPSLSTPVWTSVGTNSGNGTIMEYHDTSGGGVRFYRVSVQ
jgi:hypothetical protein